MTSATLPTTTRAARWFHALSDEDALADRRDVVHTVSDASSGLGRTARGQSRLSFHLKTLKDAGLVTDHRDGRWVYYALNREMLDEIAAFAQAVKPGKHAGSCARACCP